MTLDPRTALLELATRIDNDGTASQIGSAEEIRKIATALPPSPAVVPSKCKLVPVEPTPEMIHAGGDAIRDEGVQIWPYRAGRTAYRAMLAAAPPSPPALDGAGREGADDLRATLTEMGRVADDPMWADHVELSKGRLRLWIKSVRVAIKETP